MLFVQPMPMDDVAAANRPVAAEISTVTARTTAAPAWNGVRLAQAGTPGSSSPNPSSGSLLSPPGSAPPVDTPVPPPRPNRVDNNGRTPFDSSGSGASGVGNDPGSMTPEPPTPAEPARPDATTPSTPTPTTESPIDDTKAPAAPDQTPIPGSAGTSGTQLTPPSQLSPPNQTTTPGGSNTTPEPAPPSPPTPPADTTTPPASSSPP